ncbi:Zinc finger protein 346 [Carex littledalei]|uniref:Zinc finger protein 346 n=1 Tax=Carex littledalei TaxID=544730 RepID=A0A833VTQ6_9POAL|nr:Zinc finger protein 346 [Carex littledalei]
MDYSHEAQASHFAAPPAYYTPSTSAAAVIGPIPNPNPSYNQVQHLVPVSVSQGVDASLTLPAGYTVFRYQAVPYASYCTSIPAVAVKAPTVAQSVYCDVCKITCNSQEMYNNHVSGKKHNKNIKNLTAGDILIQFVPASTSPGTQTPGTNDNDKQFVDCDICKITCNTQEMYNNHVSGKKNNKKINNLTTGDRPIQFVPATSTSPGTQTLATNDYGQEHVPTSSQMEPKPKTKNKSVWKEDLETKKRKVLESGANGDAVKVCDLCNIVVNGPKVFEYHCKGKKHKSMVKKQVVNQNQKRRARARVCGKRILRQRRGRC